MKNRLGLAGAVLLTLMGAGVWAEGGGAYGNAGYIDKTGKLVIPKTWDSAYPFTEGLVRVEKGGLYGFIDKSGKVVIKPQFDYAFEFSEGLAAAKSAEGKKLWGYIDRGGRFVIAPTYRYCSNFANGVGRAGDVYLDKTGNEVPAPKQTGLVEFSDKDLKHGFKDGTSGEIKIKPQYLSALDFSEGLAAVQIRQQQELLWGFIDTAGKLIIPHSYGWAQPFSQGLALVSLKGKYGFIDTKGNLVIEPKWEDATAFNEGLAAVKLDGKYGFIDKTGKIVIPLQYGGAVGFGEGLAPVGDQGGGV